MGRKKMYDDEYHRVHREQIAKSRVSLRQKEALKKLADGALIENHGNRVKLLNTDNWFLSLPTFDSLLTQGLIEEKEERADITTIYQISEKGKAQVRE